MSAGWSATHAPCASCLVRVSARRGGIVGSRGDESGSEDAGSTRSMAPASVVPNGVDLTFWHRTNPQLGRDEIVFTGAMDYPPNADAAEQLVEVVLPEVQRAVPRRECRSWAATRRIVSAPSPLAAGSM